MLARITVNSKICGGRPTIRGMRIRVSDVLDLLSSGLSSEQVVEELPDLEIEDVRACLLYAARRFEHPVLTTSACLKMIWLDAQLSPVIAPWLETEFKIKCMAVRDLGLRDAEDLLIFDRAKRANAIVMTKDSDFVELLYTYGPPPRVIWLTCGNTSNENLKMILKKSLGEALRILDSGLNLVEIR